MKDNYLKKKLIEGKNIFGTWTMISSHITIDIISSTNLDFVIIDMEHGTMSFETVEKMIDSAKLRGVGPIIRVENKEENTLLRALETNPLGIMVPHIKNETEAKKIVNSCKYHPEGKRGLSPYTKVHDYSHDDISEKLHFTNENILIGVLVEGKKGIENIDKISKVDGLDLIYMGIYDISQSIGKPGKLFDEEVISLQKKCVNIIKSNNKYAGSFAKNLDYVDILYKSGFQFIAYLVDCAILRQGYINFMQYVDDKLK